MLSSFVYRKCSLIRLLIVKLPLAIGLPILEMRARSQPKKLPPLAI